MEITIADIKKTVKEALAEEKEAGIQPTIIPPLAPGCNTEPARPTQETISTLDLIDECLLYKAAAGYLKVRKRKLRFFARQYPQLPTEPEAIRTYLRQFKTADVPTRQDQWKVLSDLYKFAASKYGLPNPMLEVDKPRYRRKPGQRLSREQAEVLIRAITTDLEWALFTLHLGLRFRGGEEAEGLLCGDIKSDYIIVRGKVRTDELPLLPVFREKLLPLQTGRHPDDPLIPIKANTMAYHIEKVYKRAGIDGSELGSRRLRNTAASLWYEFGGDQASNKQLLRHSVQSMTDHYSYLTLSQLRSKEELHNPLLNLMRELGLAPPYQNPSSAPPGVFRVVAGYHLSKGPARQ